MKNLLDDVKPGICIALMILLFGGGLGITFNFIDEDIESYIENQVAAHPELHDEKSADKIWRLWQRAHFHAMGISAFTLALIGLTALADMRSGVKRLVSVLISMGGLYSVAWFVMALLAPGIGKSAAHEAVSVNIITALAIGSLSTGGGLLFTNIFFGVFSSRI
ncbi:MAG: hypothetical protein HY880_02485 [Deltaproteobacteria bacterium]|nr:hypothetical protein [Deltaproteobacteria bacterium]